MKARIIAVGDEILAGHCIDSNSAFASKQLSGLGVDPIFHETCPDDVDLIALALKRDNPRAGVVVVTGGLGPTDDDVTKEAFQKAFDSKLIFDEDAKKEIEEFLARRGEKPNPRSLALASIPRGSKKISNRWGTAPGFVLDREGIVYYCLPGVPYEFRNMFKEHVVEDLQGRLGKLPARKTVVLKMYGIPEAKVSDAVAQIPKPEAVRLGFYPKMPEVHLSVSYRNENPEREEEIQTYIEKVSDKLRDFIFARNEEKIEEKLVDALIKNKLTLSVAESCTGGLISSTIVNVSGSSACFESGVVSYSNNSKMGLLSVLPLTIKEHGAVSEQCALEMAQNIRKISGSDIGVSVTGIAGPRGGSQEKPVGTTFIGISSQNLETVWHLVFHRERNMNRMVAMYEVFTRLLKLIKNRKILS